MDLDLASFLLLSIYKLVRLYELFTVVIHSMLIAFCFSFIVFNFEPKARTFLVDSQSVSPDLILNLHFFISLPSKVHLKY